MLLGYVLVPPLYSPYPDSVLLPRSRWYHSTYLPSGSGLAGALGLFTMNRNNYLKRLNPSSLRPRWRRAPSPPHQPPLRP